MSQVIEAALEAEVALDPDTLLGTNAPAANHGADAQTAA